MYFFCKSSSEYNLEPDSIFSLSQSVESKVINLSAISFTDILLLLGAG